MASDSEEGAGAAVDTTDPGGYRAVNRECWDLLSLADDPALDEEDFESARATLDPYDWIPWDDVRTVLCLAGAGGEQGPLFAALGLDVTVADLSPGQLARDREVAEEHGLSLECLEADMADLSALYGRDFDLVYQSISSVYVPDVVAVYREVAKVLADSGLYLVEHWTATQAQLADDPWDGTAYRVARPLVKGEPIPWYAETATVGDRVPTCWHYLHPLDELVGGLCDAGFVIEGARESEAGDLQAEPGSEEHLNAFLPPFLALKARKR